MRRYDRVVASIHAVLYENGSYCSRTDDGVHRSVLCACTTLVFRLDRRAMATSSDIGHVLLVFWVDPARHDTQRFANIPSKGTQGDTNRSICTALRHFHRHRLHSARSMHWAPFCVGDTVARSVDERRTISRRWMYRGSDEHFNRNISRRMITSKRMQRTLSLHPSAASVRMIPSRRDRRAGRKMAARKPHQTAHESTYV